MLIVDSHCHIDALDYENIHANVDEVLANALALEVKHFLAVNIKPSSFNKMDKLLGKYSQIHFASGLHPLHINDEVFDLELLRQQISHHKVVAVGETGLDYHYSVETKNLQQQVFIQHVELAKQTDKPLIIHSRSARQDTIDILRSGNANKGVMHCFTEDLDMAKKALDLGFYISFSGIVTFKNAQELQQVAKYVPLDRILVETDSPYLAPVPYRGKQNQPAWVHYVCKFMADLRQIEFEKMAHITTNNFKTLFNLEF